MVERQTITRGCGTPVYSDGFSVMSQTTALDGEIRDGRHHMQIRVYYEHTDFLGIV